MTKEEKKRKKGIVFWLGASAVPAFSACAYVLLMTLNSQTTSEPAVVKTTETTPKVTTLQHETTNVAVSSTTKKAPVDESAPTVTQVETVRNTTIPPSESVRVVTTTQKGVPQDELPQSTVQVTTQSEAATLKATQDIAQGATTSRVTQGVTQSTTTSRVTQSATQSTTTSRVTQGATQSTTTSRVTQSTTSKAQTQSTTQNTTTTTQIKPNAIDKDELRRVVRDANNRQGSDYSVRSWQVLKNVLSKATVIEQNQNVTQEQVDDAVKQLRQAIDGLVVDKEALQNAIKQAVLYQRADYSTGSFDELEKILLQAQVLLGNVNAKQSQVDVMVQQLRDAIAGLTVDKTVLKNLISKTSIYVQSAYSPVAWQLYTNALMNANEIVANASAKQSQVNAALERLLQAISGLGVDKTVLKRTLDNAKTYVSTDYSLESFELLQQAITQATVVYNSATATQQEIDGANGRLNTAIAGVSVDKTALQEAIKQAQSKEKDAYSPVSYAHLQAVKQNAQEVLDKSNAKQSEVNAMVTALNNAIQQLAVDKTALQTAINDIDQLIPREYTLNSFAILQAALVDAKQVVNDNVAKQSDVNTMLNRLNDAKQQLQPLKSRPTMTVSNVTKRDAQRQVTLNYVLEDTQKAFVRAIVNVYDGVKLVKSVPVTSDGTQAQIDDLQWGVTYQLQTVMTYDLGNGEQEYTITPMTPIMLSSKTVDLTRDRKLELVRLNANGTTTVLSALDGVPTDKESLYAQFSSDTYKDVLLPIQKIEAIDENGSTNYKVTVTDSAITHLDKANNLYLDTLSFTVLGKRAAENNIYYDFDALIKAMNDTPDGTFYIGRDMTAKSVMLPNEASSYVTNTFSGTLKTADNAPKMYKISDLAMPLFNSLQGAKISNIHLANVTINTKQTAIGALAKTSSGQTVVSQVLAEGTINAPYNIGGLVYNATGSDSMFTNVGFVGDITATTNLSNDQYVGGIIGKATSVDIVSSFFDGTITARANGGSSRVGGLMGGGENWHSEIKQSYVKGTINNIGNAGQVAGITGSTWHGARAYNNVVYADVNNGNHIHGDKGYMNNGGVDNNYVVADAKGLEHPRTTTVTKNEADEKVQSYNVSIANHVTPKTVGNIFNNMKQYDATKNIAYYNAQRLLPFYNNHFIVEQGNLLTGTLATKRIQKLIPMVDKQFVPNITNEWETINALFVMYEDGTTNILPLTYQKTLENTNIVEYTLDSLNVTYTPEQFKVDLSSVLAPLATTFAQFDYLGKQMYDKFNMDAYDGTIIWETRRLEANFLNTDTEQEKLAKKRRYLIESMNLQDKFDAVKANIVDELSRSIGSHQVVNWQSPQAQTYLRQSIENNAFDILFGLAYMDRWYNVAYGEYNIKNIMKYSPNLKANQNTNTLDVLASIVNETRANLTQRTDVIYNGKLAPYTGKTSVSELLSYFNTQLGTKNDAQWLKETSKAIIREYEPKEIDQVDVSVFKFLSQGELQRMLLPLLTLSDESIYVVTNMATMNIGMTETYVNLNWKKTKPDVYKQQIQELVNKLETYGALQRDHFDLWYRLSNDNVKDKLIKTRPIFTWANLQVGVFSEDSNRRTGSYWSPSAGEKAPLGMKEFLTVIGTWMRNNGTGAYADGTDIYFIVYEPWSDYGNSVFTHEAVHNLDGTVYLGGFGRRDGMGAEAFALGMLQSADKPQFAAYGVNLANDYSKVSKRYHNGTPAQFQTVNDIDTYFKNQFDVLHTLTAIEMDALTKLTAEQQRMLLGKITPDEITPTTEKYRQFTNEEWAQLRQGKADTQATFETLAELVNAQALYFYGNRSDIRNGYATIDLFQGVYGVPEYTQTNGAGIYTFKKMAFELWAEYGYQKGFIGYTSNQLKPTAAQQGATFNDNFIIQTLSNNNYQTINQFKLASYNKALQKADSITEFSFVWKGKTYQIQNKSDLQTVFAQAINQDIAASSLRNKDNLKTLKAAIYTVLFNQTNEFRNSIYR